MSTLSLYTDSYYCIFLALCPLEDLKSMVHLGMGKHVTFPSFPDAMLGPQFSFGTPKHSHTREERKKGFNPVKTPT